jgi:hypothetical protein
VTLVRTPIQICADVAGLLSGGNRRSALIAELVSNPDVRADMIRMRLEAHKIDRTAAEEFIREYEAAKAGK